MIAAAGELAELAGYPGDRVDPHRDSARGLVVAPLWRDEMFVVLPAGIRRRTLLTWLSARRLLRPGSADARGAGDICCNSRRTRPSSRPSRTRPTTSSRCWAWWLPGSGWHSLRLSPSTRPLCRAEYSSGPTTRRDHRTIHLVGAAGSDQVPRSRRPPPRSWISTRPRGLWRPFDEAQPLFSAPASRLP